MNGVRHLMYLRRITTGTLLLGLAACGGGFTPAEYPSPDALLAASLARFEAGDCNAARQGLTVLSFELPPNDPRVADVRFYLAECQFDDHQWLEAARGFRRVADEHPDHPRAPAALLRAGESFAKLWRRPELDPTYGESALTVLRELAARYPASDAARAARGQIAALVDQFAAKDIRTGDFYLRLRAYDSAILYYRMVIQQWPETRLAPRALLRLVEAYQKIGYEEEVRETCEHLYRFYPEHPGLAARCPAPSSAP